MKPSKSLMETMNEMAANPDRVALAQKESRPRDQKREVAAFIAVDPLLADLHKHHQDAKNNMRRLIKQNGLHDPMVDVARDMTDSTLSAFETRMIEVQYDQYLRRLAFRKMKEMEEEEEKKEHEAAAHYRNHLERFFNGQREAKRKTEEERIRASDYSFNAFLTWILYLNIVRAEERLSLMQSFPRASRAEQPDVAEEAA